MPTKQALAMAGKAEYDSPEASISEGEAAVIRYVARANISGHLAWYDFNHPMVEAKMRPMIAKGMVRVELDGLRLSGTIEAHFAKACLMLNHEFTWHTQDRVYTINEYRIREFCQMIGIGWPE